MQNYESSVSFLGTWGPFQRNIVIMLCLMSIPSGFNILSTIFLLVSPPHHCHIPTNSNLSQDWIQQVAGQQQRSSCSRYELDMVKNLSVSGINFSQDQIQNQSGFNLGSSPFVLKQEQCRDGWTYSTEYFQSTAVTEFNLVCRDEWKQPLNSLVYFIGGLVGCLLSGPLSDRFGRKPVLFGATLMLSVFSSALAFAPSWPIFICLFGMMGVGQIASYIAGFVLGSEILMGSARVIFCGLCFPISYVFGIMMLTGTAYLVRSWRLLSLIMAVPGLACIPLWWLVPESPRWLVSCRRMKEADLFLRSAALKNKVEPPSVIFNQSKFEARNQKTESLGFLDLLRTTNIRCMTLILWLFWFSNTLCYFGVSFNMSNLSGNPYMNYFLLFAIELPGYTASYLAIRFFTRRLPLMCFSLLAAIALLLLLVTLDGYPNITICLVLMGKFGTLGASGLLYVYTGELSPTVIRNTAMSSSGTWGKVGSAISPYLMVLAVYNQALPWIVVSSLSFLSVLLCLFLPETFGQPLPDTIQQIPQTGFRWPWAYRNPPKNNEKSEKDQIISPEIICTTRL
ncbi:solute carrier family 22 member 5-like isoform X2 [Gouania willdenowi]|uniref:solute carrier family 22 member 5-like isoform X2 n=1 Tax=Gouania willdenowi TaxID=441366 RepID=UPI0010565B64|nr:solute carrier family 22 member 5-like isoform X2 [Gouania willdenowi]